NEPGLVLSLAQGLMAAKALSIALGLPLLGIHHLKGHLYSAFIGKKSIFPMHALIVSGGHTCILRANSYFDVCEIGSTLDDSLGEAFDKTAKMLDLGYPGGALVEELAKKGDENAFSLTIPMQKTKDIVFSYSGLKNAVRLLIQEHGKARASDICASFQKTAVAHLLQKCELFFKKQHPSDLALVGGVSANEYLRQRLDALCKKYGVQLHLCEQRFTQDNAAMIARAAIDVYASKTFASLSLDVHSRASFEKCKDDL
ncbi:MAG: tRNA (adenosine(37)-N6)-threonylcarbamoyltransferase complex transferase subunit TsaD, partial [Deltaproteobacteria bacterium]